MELRTVSRPGKATESSPAPLGPGAVLRDTDRMNQGDPLRVGFAAGDWQRWAGGVNYYRALLSAVAEDPENTLEPVLFLGREGDESSLRGFPDVTRARSTIFDRRRPAWVVRGLSRRGFNRDPLFERLLASNDVGIVSHLNQPWRSERVTTLGWIPDLQHFRIPENFSERDRAMRERQFRAIIELSRFVIVSSESSRQDLVDYAGEDARKARVLRFVPQVPSPGELPSRDSLARRFEFDGPYFHLPNQFWAHKNHGLVVDALEILKQEGQAALVLATGAPHGRSGDTEHHDAVLAAVRNRGLADRFRSLGVVPFDEMLGLMAGSLAVINPSRFEGWSTTVEEAKCLGKRVLCSSLAVHREQDPPGAMMFDPDDPEALARAMLDCLRESEGVASIAPSASADAERRRRQFSREFEAIIRDADRGGQRS